MGLLIAFVKGLEGIHFLVAIAAIVFTGGAATLIVMHSDYSYKVEQVARLQTAQVKIEYEEVTIRINTGGRNLCGLQGTYQVEIELIATIDTAEVIKNQNLLSHWDELPEPNITTAYVKSVKPLSETTNFGCNVSFTDARELARTVALVEISNSTKYEDLINETRKVTLKAYSELTGISEEKISFYDNDNSRVFAVRIENPECWGLNDSQEFVKIC